MINGVLIDSEFCNDDLDVINRHLSKTKNYTFHFEYEDDYTIYIVGEGSCSLCKNEDDKVLLFIKDNNFCVSFVNNENVSERYKTYLKEHFNINLLRYNEEIFYDNFEGTFFVDDEEVNLSFDRFIDEIDKNKNLDDYINKNLDDYINKNNEIKKSQKLDSLINQNQNKQNNKENNMQLDNLVQFKIQEKIMDTILKGEKLSISKIMMLQSFNGNTFDISDMLKIKLIEKFSLNDDKEKMDYKQIALLNMIQNGKFDFQFFFALNLVDKMVDKDDDFAEIIKLEIINSSKNGFDSSKIMELIIQQKLLSTL